MHFNFIEMECDELVVRFHNRIFDFLRVRNLFKEKLLACGGGLDFKISVVEPRGNDTDDLNGDVLDLREVQLRHGTIEKSVLFIVYDTVVGHNPNIQEIHGKTVKRKLPEADKRQMKRKIAMAGLREL